MLLSSQIRREEEFDMVRQVFAKSSVDERRQLEETTRDEYIYFETKTRNVHSNRNSPTQGS